MATLAEIQTSVEEYADYAEVGSVARARLFKTALTRLIMKLPQATSQAGASTALPIETYKRMLDDVAAWLVANDARSGANQRARTFNLSGMRG